MKTDRPYTLTTDELLALLDAMFWCHVIEADERGRLGEAARQDPVHAALSLAYHYTDIWLTFVSELIAQEGSDEN